MAAMPDGPTRTRLGAYVLLARHARPWPLILAKRLKTVAPRSVVPFGRRQDNSRREPQGHVTSSVLKTNGESV